MHRNARDPGCSRHSSAEFILHVFTILPAITHITRLNIDPLQCQDDELIPQVMEKECASSHQAAHFSALAPPVGQNEQCFRKTFYPGHFLKQEIIPQCTIKHKTGL